MAWLRTLGTIQADFSVSSISFKYHNHTITLQGDPISQPTYFTPTILLPYTFSPSLPPHPLQLPPSNKNPQSLFHTTFHPLSHKSSPNTVQYSMNPMAYPPSDPMTTESHSSLTLHLSMLSLIATHMPKKTL
jgi:hypothetical protein